jgi:hypothetical protein
LRRRGSCQLSAISYQFFVVSHWGSDWDFGFLVKEDERTKDAELKADS